MTKINYQIYDEKMNCTHLEHPTDIAPIVGDIMDFSTPKNTLFLKVVRRQFTPYNHLIIILENL